MKIAAGSPMAFQSFFQMMYGLELLGEYTE
jgi:hypothetical protein